MAKNYNKKKKASLIIPAYNEEATITNIINSVLKNPNIDEIIVVDDGSTDKTYEKSLNPKVKSIRLKVNSGKAEAMDTGVRQAKNEIVVFIDADLIGLKSTHLSKILLPLLEDKTDLNIGIRKRKNYIINKLIRFFPLIGGERALKKELWYSIPKKHLNNFEVEIAMNYFAKKLKFRTSVFFMSGVKQIIKEKKHGIIKGFYERIKMVKDVLYVSFKLYFIDKSLLYFNNLTRVYIPVSKKTPLKLK